MNAGRHKPVPSSTFSTSITSVLMRPLNTYWGPLMDLVLLVDFFPETLGRGGRRTAVTLGSGIEEMGGKGRGEGWFHGPGLTWTSSCSRPAGCRTGRRRAPGCCRRRSSAGCRAAAAPCRCLSGWFPESEGGGEKKNDNN